LVATPLDQFDTIEINEAFAAQSLACLRQLELPVDDRRVNSDGGAIAIGHPIGASGARLVTHLAWKLACGESQRAVATLCVGGGMGIGDQIEQASISIKLVSVVEGIFPDCQVGLLPGRIPNVKCLVRRSRLTLQLRQKADAIAGFGHRNPGRLTERGEEVGQANEISTNPPLLGRRRPARDEGHVRSPRRCRAFAAWVVRTPETMMQRIAMRVEKTCFMVGLGRIA